MKMIVSNYDGTIKRYIGKPNLFQNIDLKKDLIEMRKFIENGNIFTITSKRTTQSIKKELETKKEPVKKSASKKSSTSNKTTKKSNNK